MALYIKPAAIWWSPASACPESPARITSRCTALSSLAFFFGTDLDPSSSDYAPGSLLRSGASSPRERTFSFGRGHLLANSGRQLIL